MSDGQRKKTFTNSDTSGQLSDRFSKFAENTSQKAFVCVPASAEASGAPALSRDVVAQSAVATGTVLAAVDAVLAEGARLGTNRTL